MMSPYHGSNVQIRKRGSLAKQSSAPFSISVWGKSHNSSTKIKDFFDLDFSNSKSNSCRMTIHFEYFPLEIVS